MNGQNVLHDHEYANRFVLPRLENDVDVADAKRRHQPEGIANIRVVR